MFKFSFTGIPQMIKTMNAISAAVDREVAIEAKKIGKNAEYELKKELSHPGTGIRYKATKSGKYHVASAPGQPPATDLGTLKRSTHAEVSRVEGENMVSISAGSELAFYAKLLEEGTANIAPRPFFFVTLKRNMEKWFGWWKNAVARGLTRGGA